MRKISVKVFEKQKVKSKYVWEKYKIFYSRKKNKGGISYKPLSFLEPVP